MLNILQMSIISHNFPTYPEVCTIVTQFIKKANKQKKNPPNWNREFKKIVKV